MELGRVSKELEAPWSTALHNCFLFFRHMFSPLVNNIGKGVENFQCLYKYYFQGFFH